MSELVSSRIHLLPEHLVDQIKAGEVIERPANLIKEILENSLDAKAQNIAVHLVAGGMELISIEDDGIGMSFSDLPYAFCRHATSKIDKFEDLYSLGSYGFRGEALASIASIARVTCVSNQEEAKIPGGRIVIHAGATQSHQKLETGPRGTSLYIKDLFYNTPARLKFIKSATSEKNALRRTILSFILTHPGTAFTIKWDDDDKKVFPVLKDQIATQKQRIASLFNGKSKSLDFYEFSSEYEDHSVSGYFSKGSTKGSSYKKHFLFVNDRLFTDRQIHQTILRSMEALYPPGESGHYVVFLKVPPNLIDVNVHPHKTLIKFFKIQIITGLLSSEIKKLAPTTENASLEFHPIEASAQQLKNFQESASSFQETQESLNYQQQIDSSLARQPHTETRVNSRIALIQIGEDAFLMDKLRLLQNLNKYLSQSNEDNEFIPLLITEPFYLSCSIEDVEDQFKSWGLVCEKSEDSTLMLRAFHPVFNLEFAKQLIKLLIDSSFNINANQLNELSINTLQMEQLLDIQFLAQKRDSFLKRVDEDLFSTIFN